MSAALFEIHPGMLDGPTLERVVGDQVRAAPLDNEPFPHLVAHDIFPAGFYAELLDAWPAPDAFGNIGENIWGAYFKNPLGLKPLAAAPIWQEFRELVAETIIPAVFKRLAPETMPEIVEDCLLVRRDKRVLLPHIDNLFSTVQVLIYLPSDSDHEHLGTRLYRATSPGNVLSLAEQPKPGLAQFASHLNIGTTEVKRIPYRPNTLLAFVNGPDSWHGQTLREPYERRTYQCFVGAAA